MNNVFLFFLFLSVCNSVVLSRGECEPKLDSPVFFSYAWPIGPDTVRDFTKIDVQRITAIDIGPDSLSYAPSIRKSYPNEIFELWHGRGKKLIRRCYDRRFGNDGKKINTVIVEELVVRWSHAMEEPGVDGIAIDEFIRDNPALYHAWIAALGIVRGRYPNKLIFCWIAGKGLNPGPLHVAIRDYADFCMPEIYYRESTAPGYPDFEFPRFREAVDKLEKNAPGISSKILLGLGVHEKLFDDVPEIDYMEFVEAQIRHITTDPVLKKLPGLAFYAPMKLSQENIGKLDKLIGKYYPAR